MPKEGIRVEFESFRNFLDTYSHRISPTGLFVVTDQPLEVGTEIALEFSLKDGFQLLRGTGEVVWNGAMAEGSEVGMAVRFGELDDPSRQLISKINEQVLEKGGDVFDVDRQPSTAYAESLALDSDPLAEAEEATTWESFDSQEEDEVAPMEVVDLRTKDEESVVLDPPAEPSRSPVVDDLLSAAPTLAAGAAAAAGLSPAQDTETGEASEPAPTPVVDDLLAADGVELDPPASPDEAPLSFDEAEDDDVFVVEDPLSDEGPISLDEPALGDFASDAPALDLEADTANDLFVDTTGGAAAASSESLLGGAVDGAASWGDDPVARTDESLSSEEELSGGALSDELPAIDLSGDAAVDEPASDLSADPVGVASRATSEIEAAAAAVAELFGGADETAAQLGDEFATTAQESVEAAAKAGDDLFTDVLADSTSTEPPASTSTDGATWGAEVFDPPEPEARAVVPPVEMPDLGSTSEPEPWDPGPDTARAFGPKRRSLIPLLVLGGVLVAAGAYFVPRFLGMEGPDGGNAAVRPARESDFERVTADPPTPVPEEEVAVDSDAPSAETDSPIGDSGAESPEAVGSSPEAAVADEPEGGADPAAADAVAAEPAPSDPVAPAAPAQPQASPEPETRSASSSSRGLRLENVTWRETPEGTLVTLWTDRALDSSDFATLTLSVGAPRVVVKLYGVAARYGQSELDAGTSELQGLRFGYHPNQVPPEIHVVADLAGRDVVVISSVVRGKSVEVLLGKS